MDFYKIRQRKTKKGSIEVYPDFLVGRVTDLMVRGKAFYAIWDEAKGLWSTDEFDVQRLVDDDLRKYTDWCTENFRDSSIETLWMSSYGSSSWKRYRQYLKDSPDNVHVLDEKLTFANQQVVKNDYVSKKLPYPLEEGRYDAYDEIIGTLYSPEERRKLEWAIGAVVAGDSRSIQKFIVLYGEAGAGKSTILNIVQKLFEGYYTTFEAKALASSSNAFSTEVFKSNPLVAIQHDGDLSRIEDNTKLNSIISHEEMTMNEKYKPSYTSRVNCFLFMATNRPVKITDAKSGIIRRLIDVKPSGARIPALKYQALMSQVNFELGAIAYHCLQVYRELGKEYYDNYRPVEMMYKTDVFFNFVESAYFTFSKQNGTTLKQAYDIYKQYCDDALVEYRMPKYKFREELKNYFAHFDPVMRLEGKQLRNYYSGFLRDKFLEPDQPDLGEFVSLVMDQTESIFDKECADCPAQYASANETPMKKWDQVNTTLKDLDTSKLHYVKVPENHIVIDFDIKDESGEKSAELNLAEASKWPSTYAEYSKGGAGIHLHYIYDGDVSALSRVYSDGIEIKVFNGNSSLRRRLSKCNNVPIAHLNTGLPTKGEKVINFNAVKSERSLRALIERNLRKEIHPGTKPSVDFIKHILDEAYESDLKYDVSDLRPRIQTFAINSTHQSEYCLRLVGEMKFKSEEPPEAVDSYDEDKLVFFDVEVFPNLFIVNWKYHGVDMDCVRMINPSPQEIEQLFRFKLIGFNCRKYDNHILYARYLGYNNRELYKLSQKIVSGDRNAFFGEAYNISYTDVYDFASAGHKQSLKKFEIELGIHHQELALPWDEPVPESKWDQVAEYCDNDVIATEKTFDYLAGDWAARKILAELSGLTVNDTTNQHSARIIFGKNRHPQGEFVYTDLSTIFPGYKYERGKSTYRGEEPGEGGYVYAEPGMYQNVGLLDVTSMHPTSIEQLNLFGPYTKVFSDLKQARVHIKHHEWDEVRNLLDGKLAPFADALEDSSAAYSADDLSNALKTVINSIYGLTSAKFENPFKDPRNVDNIVAKRGALFMIDLKHACQEKGWTVVHIKTDSIKLANITQEMIDFVDEFGAKYGYNFEHEATYDRLCIVNDAVYIAHASEGKHAGEWTATGAQFQHPYVFKTLFSKQPIIFDDLCETKSVTSAMYLDMNEGMTQQVGVLKELKDREYNRKQSEKANPKYHALNPEFDGISDEALEAIEAGGHNYVFVGRVGQFTPVRPGEGGGILLRKKDGKFYAVGGTKGYRWLESEYIREKGMEHSVDLNYHNNLVDEAVVDISKYGDFEWFVDVDCTKEEKDLTPPWCTNPEVNECNLETCANCKESNSCAVIVGDNK